MIWTLGTPSQYEDAVSSNLNTCYGERCGPRPWPPHEANSKEDASKNFA